MHYIIMGPVGYSSHLAPTPRPQQGGFLKAVYVCMTQFYSALEVTKFYGPLELA